MDDRSIRIDGDARLIPAEPDRGRVSDRRRFVGALLASGAASTLAACARPDRPSPRADRDDPTLGNPLAWAVAWKETAAEFAALCHQAYNLARWRVEAALSERAPGGRSLAVVTDVDDTCLHASSYWGHLVDRGIDFFDDEIWDMWVPESLATPVPGSLEFFSYCAENDVEVFYVTNRDQGERTYEYALRHLQAAGFPYADDEHLTVLRGSSDKSPTIEAIASRYDVVLILGDNLNDYKRDYYVADVDERYALMERDRHDYGDGFILLPNPTDGHWVRAIFGESEPAPTVENRRILKEAAARSAWDGA